jgi:hypothetical protein
MLHRSSILGRIRRRIVANKAAYLQLLLIGTFFAVLTLSLVHYATVSADSDSHEHDLFTRFARWTFRCFAKTDDPRLQAWSQATKGTSYVPFGTPEENGEYARTCFMTTWHAIHFTGHAILVFFYPKFILEILAASTIFEMYEYISKIHDVSDIGYNVTGSLVGLLLNRLLTR